MEVKREDLGDRKTRLFFENRNNELIAELFFEKSSNLSVTTHIIIKKFRVLITSFGCSGDIEDEWVGVTLLKEVIKIAKYSGYEVYTSRHGFNPVSLFFAFRDIELEPGKKIDIDNWPGENMYKYDWFRPNIVSKQGPH
jgi:hypothetical protein